PTLSAGGIAMAGGTISGLAAGVAATDAVNVSQLSALGGQTATALGGGASYTVAGGLTVPSYSVGGTAYNNVGAALTALQSGAPVQYTTAAGSTTPNGLTPSNTMTLVGTGAGNATPVSLANVAAATLSATSTQAVNGSQLYATNQNVAQQGTTIASGLGGGSTYNAATGAVTTSLTLPSTGATTYSSVETALTALDAAASAGWNLQTNGGASTKVAPGGTVNFVAGSNAVVTNAGTAVTVGVVANPTFASVAITGGPTLSSTGIAMAGGTISGLAAGVNPADAVNVSQLSALGGQTATALGGGSAYTVAGGLTVPSYSVGGTAYNNVGAALTALQSGAPVQYTTAAGSTT
ncbi:MAG: hypothetical protein KGI47_12010, partial [Betaproteobacteria bacterium]|nr:hypothetical protein [Betaproteobacteria bacterium]